MRIVLYTPSIRSPSEGPSGAAAGTEALAGALALAGHRTVGPAGDRAVPAGAARYAAPPGQTAAAAVERLGPPDRRPDLWITYGLRDDAADRIGPDAARGLGIPYVLVDPRGRAGGGEGSRPALQAADAVIPLSAASLSWTTTLRPDVAATRLLPFIDPGPYDAVRRQHGHQAASLAMRLGLRRDTPTLLCVSAMRPGDRLAGYRVLARALSRLAMVDWQAIVVGDGPARAEVEAMLRRLPLGRVHLTGALPEDQVMTLYAMSDLLIAPSVGGTHGRVLLEAQASGLPVLAGDAPGVRDAVHDGVTGRLCPEGNAESLAQAIAFLLRERRFLSGFAAGTTHAIGKDHHIAAAAVRLDEILTAIVR